MPLVATVLTVYGIETLFLTNHNTQTLLKLQQYLPFTVLKPPPQILVQNLHRQNPVATVLTVYGIETLKKLAPCQKCPKVATVLTVYGIETIHIG